MMTYSIFATKEDTQAAIFVRGCVDLLKRFGKNNIVQKTFNQTFDETCQYKNQVHEIMKLRYSEETP